ncbi:BTB/POZ domain-containing protein 9-like [Anopheles arabiensis]|uniref:BTB/POZ domain-containing protein 9-like n=1 Tax=Anopheles arabiensis TaxID=7173 RepID=UPI001AACF0B7|nr:BTB/POZ domain-containing protein 9-like [Anopheles arabiensis]
MDNSSISEIDQTALLVSHLAQMCMDADNADVTFIVKGEHLPAHRNILAARSEYFRALLYGGLKESKQNEIALDVPVEAFKFLMKYIYTGRLPLKKMKNTDILDILELAHQYGFIDLQTAISDYLCKDICMDNVCYISRTACLLDLNSLSTACYTFMDENASSVLKSDMFRSISYEALFGLLKRTTFFADEVEIFKAVHDWCRFNEAKSDKAEKLYNQVRFMLMSQHDLLNVVRSANVLDPNRLLDIIAEKEKSSELPHRATSLAELTIANDKIKWSPTFSNMLSLNGEIDLGKHIMVNCIRVEKSNGWYKSIDRTYVVEVSVDNQRWSKGVTCTASTANVTVTHFPAGVARYIRVSQVQETYEISVIKAMCQKLKCTCPTGEKKH